MASLLSGMNWNEFRKGYREGELEDQADERFEQDTAYRDLQYENLLQSIETQKQAAPLRLQMLGNQAALSSAATPLEIRRLERTDALGAATQPGALAGAQMRSEFATELSKALDPAKLAQAKATGALSQQEYQNLLTQAAIQRAPAQQALADQTIAAQSASLAADQSLLPARTNLTSARIGAETSLLPGQTQLKQAQIGAATELLPLQTGVSREQLTAQGTLIPAQTNAQLAQLADAASLRPEQFRLAAQSIAAQVTDLDRRAAANGILDRITNLQQFLSNPQAISTAAQEQGMTPEMVARQTDAQIRQLAGAFMSATGQVSNSYQLGVMSPQAQQDALMRAGRVNPDGTPRTNTTGNNGASGGGKPNPLLQAPVTAAPTANPASPLVGSPTANSTPAAAPRPANLLPTPDEIKRQTEARQQSEKIKQRQKAAVEALGPAPKIPDGVPDEEVKAIQKGVRWGDYTDDTLKAIIGSTGYTPAQVAAAQQELYKRRKDKAMQQAASPRTANELIESLFNW